MSEQGRKAIKDSLDAEIDNREAITAIMQRYDIDESAAKELWAKFIETVKKMKTIAEKRGKSEEAVH